MNSHIHMHVYQNVNIILETHVLVAHWFFVSYLSFSLSIPGLKLKQENSKQSQAHELFKQCLQAYKDDAENFNEIPEISQVLFVTAEVGNVEFLVKLICFDFDLLWKTNNKKSIFHIAVEKRAMKAYSIY